MASARLRLWRPTDAPAVASMVTDPHIVRWSSLPDIGPDAWIAEQVVGERGPSRAICTSQDDTLVGKIALRLPGYASPATTAAAIRPEDHRTGELSYWIVPAARGRGLSLAAVRLMLELAREAGLRTVVLDIEVDNHASLRVAERLGAQRRAPERTERDRAGVPRTLAVHVLEVNRGI